MDKDEECAILKSGLLRSVGIYESAFRRHAAALNEHIAKIAALPRVDNFCVFLPPLLALIKCWEAATSAICHHVSGNAGATVRLDSGQKTSKRLKIITIKNKLNIIIYESKAWDKVSNLSNEELFVHVNISASACMNRIANVMNKFNLSESDVEIKLK